MWLTSMSLNILLRPVLLQRYVTPRKSEVEGGCDLASPYVVHPCLHAQWSHILGLVRGGDKDLSQDVNKPVRVGPSRLLEWGSKSDAN